ncbi:BCCT family transporter [Microlunatus antarcticus]|uniref:Choline/carnitine/betaine transport n=1 Tax=Microlunatus antarcticus TaxID=53388 RepID=A0A7W5JV11_9ACTN|nr:BCCT family transporter [Microlunatus antarcticus]MBB3326748.1 choline/carnitine/betaine transport [Microlunatus antarcticus]
MTDLKPSPTPVDLHDVDPPVTGPAEEATDQTADDRSLLARIRSHLPDNFKAEAEGRGIDWVVFGVVALLAVGFVLWGFLGTDSLATASTNALGTLIGATGWAFVLTASLFVVFVLWLALGKFGSIPLGQDGEKPAFKTWSWISMMFAAGMGIGLMFYGVAEPLYHYVSPPPGTVDGQTPAAIQTAMATSLFHWTLHPWAMYAVVGLAMAYGTYRMGRRQLLSDIFTPLFGRKAVDGAGGKVINILAIFATLFGSAASLGLGAIQIGGGLEANGVISAPSRAVYVVIIAILTVCFVASAVSGIERGIQWLSNTNMVLAILLALLVFVVGPTIFILNMIPSALGDYIRDLPDMSARTAATGDAETTAWLASWTIFYWAWWVSWTPFVGMFIARISRGRTIRQFVTGVLLVPSVVSLLWFAIFGGAAIGLQEQATAAGGSTSMVTTVDGAPSVSFDGALYNLIDTLGMSPVLTTVAIVLVMVLVGIFFVTGADSASIIMGSISSYGVEEPRKPLIVFWGVLMGCVAAVMLVAGGDDPTEALSGLQRITIISAVPFILVMVLMCVALTKDLYRDPITLRKRLTESVVERSVRVAVDQHQGETFDMVTLPTESTPEAASASPGEYARVRSGHPQ